MWLTPQRPEHPLYFSLYIPVFVLLISLLSWRRCCLGWVLAQFFAFLIDIGTSNGVDAFFLVITHGFSFY